MYKFHTIPRLMTAFTVVVALLSYILKTGFPRLTRLNIVRGVDFFLFL
jgi:hypothetical protein